MCLVGCISSSRSRPIQLRLIWLASWDPEPGPAHAAVPLQPGLLETPESTVSREPGSMDATESVIARSPRYTTLTSFLTHSLLVLADYYVTLSIFATRFVGVESNIMVVMKGMEELADMLPSSLQPWSQSGLERRSSHYMPWHRLI